MCLVYTQTFKFHINTFYFADNYSIVQINNGFLNYVIQTRIRKLKVKFIILKLRVYKKFILGDARLCKFSENFCDFAIFTLSNAKHGGKYWNRSRGKLAFKGLSGKDYRTHGLN